MPSSKTLLILDMINAFAFPGGGALLAAARKIAPTVNRIRSEIRGQGGTCIYVNDNFGEWQSDFRALASGIAQTRGGSVLERIMPGDDDLFVLKPKHSAFYQTPLPTLLDAIDARSLVICGIETEACVMATALDAHMREFEVHVPANAVASASVPKRRAALLLLRHNRIDTRTWRSSAA